MVNTARSGAGFAVAIAIALMSAGAARPRAQQPANDVAELATAIVEAATDADCGALLAAHLELKTLDSDRALLEALGARRLTPLPQARVTRPSVCTGPSAMVVPGQRRGCSNLRHRDGRAHDLQHEHGERRLAPVHYRTDECTGAA